MTTRTEIVVAAKDETRQAFDSVNAGLSRLTGANVNLASSFKTVALAATGLAGVTSLTVLKSRIDEAIGAMGGLKDASEATGASVENLSALKGVARIGGRDFEAIEASIAKLNKALHATDDESKGAGKALAAMGLDIQALRQMDPAEAFLSIARAQEKFADGGGKTAALMTILGKNAATLIPYLHDLAEQEKLVGSVTAAQAADADAYEKNVKRLEIAVGALSRQIGGAVVGPLRDITDWMVRGQREGGLLEATFLGIGAAVVKVFGGEINPARVMEQNAARAFEEVASLRKRVAATQADIEAGSFGLLGKDFSNNRLRDLQRELGAAERRLQILTEKNRARAAAEVDAAKPKDDSLNRQQFGAAAATQARADAAADIIRRLDEQIAVKALDLQATGKLTESEREYAKVLQQLDSGSLKATAAQRDMILAKLDVLKLQDADLAAQESYRQALEAQSKTMAEHLPRLEEEARKIERNAELYGMTEAQIAALSEARLADALALAKQNGALPEQIEFLEKELALRQRITQASETLAEKQAAAKDAAKDARDVARDLGLTFSSAFEDAIVKGKKFSEVLRGVAEDILRIVVRRKITEPLAAAVSGSDFLGSLTAAFGFHAGGLVGESGATFTRGVPLAAFAGAQRYHRGGWPGLRNDEVPAILQRGERVLPRGAGTMAPEINIYTAPGSTASVNNRRGENGRPIIDIVIEAAKNAVAGDIARGGTVAAAMENTYALNRSAGAWR